VAGRDGLKGLLAGLVTGVAGGFFGVGGGAVMVPLLTGPLGLTQHEAHGTSLATIGLMSLVSIVVYAIHGNVDWITAALIAVTSVITARFGAKLAQRTSPRRLTQFFALLLAILAARLLLWAPQHTGVAIEVGAARVAFLLALGLVVGMLAGFMGVGGGILVVPALTLLFGIPQQLAQGTSLAVILAAAPAGAIEHARHGSVVGRLVPRLALGGAIGGAIASFFAQRVSSGSLTRAFGLFLLFNAVHTWVRAQRRTSRAKDEESGLEG
jgi:uncharacterized membrane protein YfcA